MNNATLQESDDQIYDPYIVSLLLISEKCKKVLYNSSLAIKNISGLLTNYSSGRV